MMCYSCASDSNKQLTRAGLKHKRKLIQYQDISVFQAAVPTLLQYLVSLLQVSVASSLFGALLLLPVFPKFNVVIWASRLILKAANICKICEFYLPYLFLFVVNKCDFKMIVVMRHTIVKELWTARTALLGLVEKQKWFYFWISEPEVRAFLGCFIL